MNTSTHLFKTMKQLLTLCASVVLATGALASNEEGTTRYKVDASASSITWHATKVTGEHMGTVNVANGYLSVEDGTLIAANIIANMDTNMDTNSFTNYNRSYIQPYLFADKVSNNFTNR